MQYSRRRPERGSPPWRGFRYSGAGFRKRFVRLHFAFASLACCAMGSDLLAGETTLDAYYVVDFWENTKGGIRTGETLMQDAGLNVSSSFDAFFGDGDASFFAYILWNDGNTFSEDYVGDLQVVSNIDAGRALRLYEFWYEQAVASDMTLRVGLYDLNSEFDAIDSSGLFINSSHGIGADYSQSGENGPSIFPVTSLTARLDWQLNDSASLRFAVLDGVPGDPEHPSRTTIHLGGDDGLLNALEYNHQFQNDVRLGIGAWLYTADFELLAAPGDTDNGNHGLYGFVDAPLYRIDSGTRIDGFFRYGVADDRFNMLDQYLGAGIVFTGLFAPGKDDQLGIAVARAHIGEPAREAALADGLSFADAETNIELTYNVQLTDWLRIQPKLQYIIDPGADPAIENALVVGLRFELTTSSGAVSHEWP